MLTLEQFKKSIPTNKDCQQWYDLAVELFPKYGLTTTNRIAGFLAQAGHESSDFKVIQENLNYSEAGLLKTFPKYFTKSTAKQYSRKPEMIANHVYDDANRTNKIGNTEPGDGWRFRGRGLIQLTGRWNYSKFGQTINKTAEEAAAYMETKKGAMESALWFWKANNLDKFADSNDIEGMSRRVNGGDIGMSDRVARYNTNKAVFDNISKTTSFPTSINDQITDSVTQIIESIAIQRGSRGDIVRRVQESLKIAADGIYGVTTEAAVRSWQRNNKYPVTGKLDEKQTKQIIGG